MNRLIVAAALLLMPFFLRSQIVEAGFSGGVAMYSGDLTPKGFGLYLQDSRPAIGFFSRMNFSSRLAARFAVNFASVGGDDENTPNVGRGLSFQSDILEISSSVEWNVFRLGSSEYGEVFPFVFAGIGFFHMSPEARLEDTWVMLQALGTEGQGLPGYPEPYNLYQLMVPFGAGFKLKLNERTTLGIEFSARKLFTDYLDDVSATQVNYLDVLNGNGKLAAQFSNPNINPDDPGDAALDYMRGSPYNDWYYMLNATLSFRLKEKAPLSSRAFACPKFK